MKTFKKDKRLRRTARPDDAEQLFLGPYQDETTEKEFNELVNNVMVNDKAEYDQEQLSLYLDKHFSLVGFSKAELKKLNGPNAKKLHNEDWKNYAQELWLRRFIDHQGVRFQTNKKEK